MEDSSNLSVKKMGFVGGPLLFFVSLFFINPTFISPGANKVIGLAIWIIVWWISEAVPISITAFLPLVLFPFMGVMKMSEAAAPYANPIVFLFFGGFLIALALEKHRLHERIALNLVKVTGTSGNGIILGFMVATSFISMWISNTATAMMMLPIALSVINLLKSDPTSSHENLPRGERNFAIGLMLMVGYASSIGGIATIIGTPPNVVFAGLLDQFYHRKLDFGKWMLIGLPLMVLILFAAYWIIVKLLFPNGIKKVRGSDELINEKLHHLGNLRKEEKFVMAIFLFTCLLWIFQQPINLFFGSDVLNDTNVAMMGGLLMFVVPVNWKQMHFILQWQDTERLAWGILFLFGGGLCLAQGLSNAGIIQVVGAKIAAQSSSTQWLIFGLITVSVLITELMSNVALVQIFIPVVFGIATNLGVDPLLLGIPVTIGASMAFMFPVATPPNAIIFSSGHMKVKHMMKAGALLNIVSIILIYIASQTLIKWVYGI
jgi:solute carrier family 13 (sodium-dependent dicarboxylate transporter), member 2/3/5